MRRVSGRHAISFDPRRAELAKVQESLDLRLEAMGLSLLAMRIMSGRATSPPCASRNKERPGCLYVGCQGLARSAPGR
jgi:hypothetical protein